MNQIAKRPRMATRAGFLLGALLLAGCQSGQSPRDFTLTLPRFFLESADARGTEVVLPKSGVRLTVNAKPVLTEGDIVNVELVQVDLGKCLVFQVTKAAARDLYRLSASSQGRRLVLTLDGVAVGARRLDGPISDGAVFVFVEIADSALPKLVDDLKQSSAALQRAIARKS